MSRGGCEWRGARIHHVAGPVAPERDCPLCPRLAAFREGNRAEHPDWFNAPVPTFGALDVRLLIVGLAPGLRGANRTGLPLHRDYAGDLLYATLLSLGSPRAPMGRAATTGSSSSIAPYPMRCAACRRRTNRCRRKSPVAAAFSRRRSPPCPNLVAILALGRIAHDSVVRTLGSKLSAHPFAHGRHHRLITGAHSLSLFDSYHCSRYNTNTAY